MVRELGPIPRDQAFYDWNQHLPFSNDLIQEESRTLLKDICNGLSTAIYKEDFPVGTHKWIAMLRNYMNLEHEIETKTRCQLIVLLFDLTFNPLLDATYALSFARLCNELLKDKKKIVPGEDLVLEWKPCVDWVLQQSEKGHKSMPIITPQKYDDVLKKLSLTASRYFPPDATSTIVSLLVPRYKYSLVNSMLKNALMNVLPISTVVPTPPEGVQISSKPSKGSELPPIFWIPMMATLAATSIRDPRSGAIITATLARISEEQFLTPENTQFTQEQIVLIMEFVLCSISLPLDTKDPAVAAATQLDQVPFLMNINCVINSATFFAWAIRNNELEEESSSMIEPTVEKLDILGCLETLMNTISNFCHPTNSGKWTYCIVFFLAKLMATIERRINLYDDLSDEIRKKIVELVRPAILLIIFNSNPAFAGPILEMVSSACYISPAEIIPFVFEAIYPTLEESATDEQNMDVVTRVIMSMIRPILEVYPQATGNIVELLDIFVEGIDVNNVSKTYVTIQFALSCFVDRPPSDEFKMIIEPWTIRALERVFLYLENLPHPKGDPVEHKAVVNLANLFRVIEASYPGVVFDRVFRYATEESIPHAIVAISYIVGGSSMDSKLIADKYIPVCVERIEKELMVNGRCQQLQDDRNPFNMSQMSDCVVHWYQSILSGAIRNANASILEPHLDSICNMLEKCLMAKSFLCNIWASTTLRQVLTVLLTPVQYYSPTMTSAVWSHPTPGQCQLGAQVAKRFYKIIIDNLESGITAKDGSLESKNSTKWLTVLKYFIEGSILSMGPGAITPVRGKELEAGYCQDEVAVAELISIEKDVVEKFSLYSSRLHGDKEDPLVLCELLNCIGLVIIHYSMTEHDRDSQFWSLSAFKALYKRPGKRLITDNVIALKSKDLLKKRVQFNSLQRTRTPELDKLVAILGYWSCSAFALVRSIAHQKLITSIQSLGFTLRKDIFESSIDIIKGNGDYIKFQVGDQIVKDNHDDFGLDYTPVSVASPQQLSATSATSGTSNASKGSTGSSTGGDRNIERIIGALSILNTGLMNKFITNSRSYSLKFISALISVSYDSHPNVNDIWKEVFTKTIQKFYSLPVRTEDDYKGTELVEGQQRKSFFLAKTHEFLRTQCPWDLDSYDPPKREFIFNVLTVEENRKVISLIIDILQGLPIADDDIEDSKSNGNGARVAVALKSEDLMDTDKPATSVAALLPPLDPSTSKPVTDGLQLLTEKEINGQPNRISTDIRTMLIGVVNNMCHHADKVSERTAQFAIEQMVSEVKSIRSSGLLLAVTSMEIYRYRCKKYSKKEVVNKVDGTVGENPFYRRGYRSPHTQCVQQSVPVTPDLINVIQNESNIELDYTNKESKFDFDSMLANSNDYSATKFYDYYGDSFVSWPTTIKVRSGYVRDESKTPEDLTSVLSYYDPESHDFVKYLLSLMKTEGATPEAEKNVAIWKKFFAYNSQEATRESNIHSVDHAEWGNFNGEVACFAKLISHIVENQFFLTVKPLIEEYLFKTSGDDNGNGLKVALEIISGIVCGQKYWTNQQLKGFWDWFNSVFERIFDELTPQTLPYVASAIEMMIHRRDPKRVYPLVKIAFDLAFKVDITKPEMLTDVKRTTFIQVILLNDGQRTSGKSGRKGRPEGIGGHRLRGLALKFVKHVLKSGGLSHPYDKVRSRLAIVVGSVVGPLVTLGSESPLRAISATSEFGKRFGNSMEPQVVVGAAGASGGGEEGALWLTRNDELKNEFKAIMNELFDTTNNGLGTRNDRDAGLLHVVQQLLLEGNPSVFGDLLKQIVAILERTQGDKDSKKEVVFESQLVLCLYARRCVLLGSTHGHSNSLDTNLSILISNTGTNTDGEPSLPDSNSSKWQVLLRRMNCAHSVYIRHVFQTPREPTVSMDLLRGLLRSRTTTPEVRRATASLVAVIVSSASQSFVERTVAETLRKSNVFIRSKKGQDSMDDIRCEVVGVLGGCVLAFPYTAPSWLPDAAYTVGTQTSHRAPVGPLARSVVADFRRTHAPLWKVLARNIPPEHADLLRDLLAPPSYYA